MTFTTASSLVIYFMLKTIIKTVSELVEVEKNGEPIWPDVSGRLTSGEMCAGFRRQKEEEDGNIFTFFITVFYEYS